MVYNFFLPLQLFPGIDPQREILESLKKVNTADVYHRAPFL